MRIGGALRGLFLSAVITVSAMDARAQDNVPLVADLSEHLVAITSRFTGTDVLLFGATDGPGDVAIVVRGPAKDEVVRRKTRVGPLWLNTEQVTFALVPSYYRVVSSRPIEEFAATNLMGQYQIGVSNLRMLMPDEDLPPDQRAQYREAFVRLKTSETLYDQGLGALNFMSNRLFHAELHFPSNVPVGTYLVEVYLFREGRVAAAVILPLTISKIGVGADIYDFAHNLAPLYGLLSVLLAAGAGWAASAVFRRV